MNKSYFKYILRCLRKKTGRLFAIFAIIILGVGFYSGLKATKPSMIKSASEYLNSNKIYDYKIISSIGFSEDEVEQIKSKEKVEDVSGGYDIDFLTSFDESEIVLRAHLIDENIDTIYLIDGEMPHHANECVVDAEYFGDYGDVIGKTITISDSNEKNTSDTFRYKEYVITGTVYSPMYFNHQKGNTNLGNGKLSSFVYLYEDSLKFDYYNVIYLTAKDDYVLFEEESDDALSDDEDVFDSVILSALTDRYDDIVSEIKDKKALLDDALTQINSIDANLLNPELYPEREEDPQYLELLSTVSKKDEIESSLADVNEMLDTISLETYIQTRADNLGYSSFENDVEIIDGIARVFPVFFLLIAMLICSTTMTRLAKEERTEIGSLYSIGYSKSSIYTKYSIYASLPSILGCAIGFAGGSYFFPGIIWQAYKMMYCLPAITSYFEWNILAISFLFSIASSLFITLIVIAKTLKESPASLLRPEAPVAGKKILLERIGFLWKRFKFSHKITIRNICRYKIRVLMTVIGIAGCTILVVTGLGIKDSIANIAENQFGEIQLYDVYALYSDGIEADDLNGLPKELDSYIKLMQNTVEIKISDSDYKTINLMVSDEENYSDYFVLNDGEKTYNLPAIGNVIIDEKTANEAKVNVGDYIDLKIDDNKFISLKVSSIVQNYVYHYLHMSAETYEEYFDEDYVPNMLFIKNDTDMELLELSKAIKDNTSASYVGIMNDTKASVEDVMKSLNFVVYVIIFCGGLLALIVLLNLGNINIAEREREIATVKVLGFYKRETLNYVFRENILLTIIGIIIGIPAGKLLHIFVMKQINIDIVTFKSQILGQSYLISVLIVIVFSLFVNLLLRSKINNVNMIEALKSNE